MLLVLTSLQNKGFIGAEDLLRQHLNPYITTLLYSYIYTRGVLSNIVNVKQIF